MKKISVGIQDFKELINTGNYYVDKTPTIYHLLTTNKYYFLSRPRRFGKSLTLSMMKYLYLGEKELFKNTFMYDNWDFTQTNPVIYMSFASYKKGKDLEEFITEHLEIFIDDEKYKISDFINDFDLGLLSKKIYEKTQKQVSIFVDEYDKVVLEHLQDPVKAEEYREYFGGFYAGIKDADPYIKVFFLTGLTKILKMNIFSSLNNLKDISFDPVAYNIMGYNWQDIESNFSDELQELAKENNIPYNEVKQKCQLMYNGYNFGSKQNDTIYNPWNINNLILDKKFEYYWSNTGIPSAIVDYIKAKHIDVGDLVEKINNEELRIDESWVSYIDLQNIQIGILLKNLGYLTIIKNHYDTQTLGFGNLEMKQGLINLFKN